VKKGLPFRKAHGITGQLVSHAIATGKTLESMTLADYHEFSPLFAEDLHDISVARSASSKNVIGGTAPTQVAQQLERARKIVAEFFIC
jgi:argininosuccinate lyase